MRERELSSRPGEPVWNAATGSGTKAPAVSELELTDPRYPLREALPAVVILLGGVPALTFLLIMAAHYVGLPGT